MRSTWEDYKKIRAGDPAFKEQPESGSVEASGEIKQPVRGYHDQFARVVDSGKDFIHQEVRRLPISMNRRNGRSLSALLW